MAKLEVLAELVGGNLIGDPDLEIRAVAPLDKAEEGEIAFLSNPRYLKLVPECRASAIILPPGVEFPCAAAIVCRNPYLAFAQILTFLTLSPSQAKGVMAGSSIAQSAVLGNDVTVYPGCVVGEHVRIGDGVILYPNVVLYDGVEIGDNSLLHAGVVVREPCRIGANVIIQPKAVIGGDGFGFAPDGEAYFKIPQVGVVVIEDDVEIGANTCIDRATLGETRIRRGTKIDNLVQVGHNVVIGENTIIVFRKYGNREALHFWGPDRHCRASQDWRQCHHSRQGRSRERFEAEPAAFRCAGDSSSAVAQGVSDFRTFARNASRPFTVAKQSKNA